MRPPEDFVLGVARVVRIFPSVAQNLFSVAWGRSRHVAPLVVALAVPPPGDHWSIDSTMRLSATAWILTEHAANGIPKVSKPILPLTAPPRVGAGSRVCGLVVVFDP